MLILTFLFYLIIPKNTIQGFYFSLDFEIFLGMNGVIIFLFTSMAFTVYSEGSLIKLRMEKKRKERTQMLDKFRPRKK